MAKKANEMKADVKSINNAAYGVAKQLQNNKNEAKRERKNLTQTINYLCAAETESGKMFREFFALEKGANKETRKKVAKYISAHLPRAIAVYTEEWHELENRLIAKRIFCKYVPCNSKGKEITDYLDVITDMVKIERVNRPKRMEIGRQMAKLWQSEYAKNDPDKKHYATALNNTFKKHLDKLSIKTQILGMIIK